MHKRLILAVSTLLALSAAPASAAAVDWTFGDHLGNLGNTQTFTSSGIGLVLTARGFTGADVGTGLFGKSLAATDERGLGLQNDPSGEGEITGRNFVQLNLDGIRGQLSGFQFSMNSSTNGEAWAVYGSDDLHPFQFTLLASGTDEGVLHTLPGGYDNYNFFATGGGDHNVLLGSFDAVTAVPEASTWAMMILGFFGIGGISLLRRREGQPFRLA